MRRLKISDGLLDAIQLFVYLDVFPQQIEGVKLMINKTLSSFFQVCSYMVQLWHCLLFSTACFPNGLMDAFVV